MPVFETGDLFRFIELAKQKSAQRYFCIAGETLPRATILNRLFALYNIDLISPETLVTYKPGNKHTFVICSDEFFLQKVPLISSLKNDAKFLFVDISEQAIAKCVPELLNELCVYQLSRFMDQISAQNFAEACCSISGYSEMVKRKLHDSILLLGNKIDSKTLENLIVNGGHQLRIKIEHPINIVTNDTNFLIQDDQKSVFEIPTHDSQKIVSQIQSWELECSHSPAVFVCEYMEICCAAQYFLKRPYVVVSPAQFISKSPGFSEQQIRNLAKLVNENPFLQIIFASGVVYESRFPILLSYFMHFIELESLESDNAIIHSIFLCADFNTISEKIHTLPERIKVKPINLDFVGVPEVWVRKMLDSGTQNYSKLKEEIKAIESNKIE